MYNLGFVKVGRDTTISQRAHICAGTHDYTDPTSKLLRCEVSIESKVWICADAFVGPNVNVSEGAVVGARCVVVKDVAKWTVVGGNPAREIGVRRIRKG